MNWGNLLLENVFVEGLGNFIYMIIDNVLEMLPSFLYMIWRLLAWIVSGVESIFRNLAGIGESGKDMITLIIQNKSVDAIFKNLIGLSTALIIFFTIIKIIQEHYKEKDGGNPYKIVIRTFKGLLMFFFVSAAVSVGLKTTQVMFRALDAATGSGNTASIAGSVFKAMAYDANRKRIGLVTEEDAFGADMRNQHIYRLIGDHTDDGKYVLIEMTDKNKPTTAAEWRDKYYELFPSSHYGVVNADGSITPLSQWAQILADEESDDSSWGERWNDSWAEFGDETKKDFEDYIEFEQTSGDITDVDDFIENGEVSGSFGFRSDILSAFTTNVQPSINLAWSPVDIVDYFYALDQVKYISHDIDTTVMGSGTKIPMGTTFVAYKSKGEPVKKSLEDSAKKFGFTFEGKVGLQGDEVSASFSLDTFKPELFLGLLSTILTNVVYTNLTQKAVEAIPMIPASTHIFAVDINYLQLLGPLLMKIFQNMNETFMGNLGLIPKDENGNPLAETFVVGPSTHNGDIWVSVNDRAQFLDLTIEKYQFANHFITLWSQLTDSFKDLINQMEQSSGMSWDNYETDVEELNGLSNKITTDQKEWRDYDARINLYNKNAISMLSKLGNYLNLYEALLTQYPDFETGYEGGIGTGLVDDLLASKGFPGTWETLESSITSTFANLVSAYVGVSPLFSEIRPTNNFADLRIVPSIYQPIIELNMTENRALSMSASEVRNAMFNKDDNNGKVTVNMFFEDNKAYRLIDWSAYCGMTNANGGIKDVFGDYIDFYCANPIDPKSESHDNTPMIKHKSQDDLVFMNYEQNESWESVGLNYFISNTAFQSNNPFIKQTRAGGFNKSFRDSSYWGSRGVTMGDTRYYQEYQNGLPKGNSLNSGFIEHSGPTTSALSLASVDLSAVRTSSANLNALVNAGKLSTLSEIEALADTDAEIDTELMTEFQKNIITFRDLRATSQQSEDKKVLKDWCKNVANAKPTGSYNAKMLYNFTADEIDDMMASAAGGDVRRYLMLTAKNTVNIGEDGKNLQSYIGTFSYSDPDVVRKLYDVIKINFAVGYIAIIAALGVYLNFAFGLIQRAVNMAVLYVMSPVTIAFYPFDDGSKFNSQFVTPFYKEAISAFAVIASLNIFIVLMQPVEDAVKEVTGGGMSGSILSWLSLVAFVSMLPQIRNTICTVLGAGQMSAKSLGSVWSDAKKSMDNGIMKGLKNAGKKAAGFGAGLRNARDRVAALKKDSKAWRDDFLAKKAARGGKVGSWAQAKLDKAKAKESKRKENQEKIDAAIAKGSKDGLTKRQSRMYDRQVKAAEMQAKRNIGGKQKGETKEQYAARVNAEKTNLLSNPDFRKSVSGVIKSNRAIQGAKNVLSAIGDTKAGARAQLIGKRLFGKGSTIGEAIRSKYGIDGTKTQDKNSLWGEFNRWRDPLARQKAMNDFANKEITREAELKKYREALASGLTMGGENTVKGNKVIADEVKKQLIREEFEAKKNNFAMDDKLTGLLTEKYMAEGKSFEDARRDAKLKTFNMNENEKQDLYNELGGDNKLADGLARGLKGLSGLDLDLGVDFKDEKIKQRLKKLESELRLKAQSGSDNIGTELAAATEKQTNAINSMAYSMAQAMGKEGDEKTVKAIAKTLEKVEAGTAFESVVGKIADAAGVDEKEAQKTAAIFMAQTTDSAFVQNSHDMHALKAALEAAKLYEKGDEMFRGKIGDSVSAEDKQAILQIVADVNDEDYTSTNENSLGFKINAIIESYEGKGGLDNPACQAAIDAEKKRMKAMLDAKLKEFEARYADDIRRHDVSKKFVESKNAIDTMSMMTEYQHQREFHIGTKMDAMSVQVVVNDSKIQEMHNRGDYAGAGLVLQQVVDKVMQHDYEGAKSLGVDQDTIDKLRFWEQRGDTDRLNGIRGLGVLDAAHMGSTSAAMGGDTMLGMETAFAQVTSLAEKKIIINKFNAALEDAAHNEARARSEVNQILGQIETNFSGAMWKELRNQLGVASESDFTNLLRDTMIAVNSGTSLKNEKVKKVTEAFEKFRDAHINDLAYQEQLGIAKTFTLGIARANEANELSDRQDELNNGIKAQEGSLQEQMAKLKNLPGAK
ncbi:MAG: hypothetical protein J6B20_02675 [Clostridia bacterium]|nr:hypothetical protein [Clostridia bacterium]